MTDGLHHLHHSIGCVHGLIDQNTFIWDNCRLRIAHWAINILTQYGQALDSNCLLPTDIRFLAPEQVKSPFILPSRQSDVWSCSLLLLTHWAPNIKLPNNPARLAFCKDAEQVFKLLQFDTSVYCGEREEDRTVLNFFTAALNPDPKQRADTIRLYKILDQIKLKSSSCLENPDRLFAKYNLNSIIDGPNGEWVVPTINLNVSEIYHLWRLSSGRNFESECKQDELPPILRLPYFIAADQSQNNPPGTKQKTHMMINTEVRPVMLEQFKQDLSKIDESILYPLVITNANDPPSITAEGIIKTSDKDSYKLDVDSLTQMQSKNRTPVTDCTSIAASSIDKSSHSLPLIIREADSIYQCQRIALFKKLLAGCPYLKPQLTKEAIIDIPPFCRARTWAVLLDVKQSSLEVYDQIDKTTPTATDRQISVDIPRCHQYNELMASPQGHMKLARILKAWLNYNKKEYVYWQGVDSIAAPFLLVNFADEAMAFACFDSFVHKYLCGFFQKDNQVVVQQYLAMFSELLTYHDPILADHLDRLGFQPNLYAIPWFLTMFTHVLPLHKILHVWDSLLLGNEKFPLCVGLAILTQLRGELLQYSFNDCIVVFSDLPEIDLERCVRDACHFYYTTPESLINLSK